MSDTPIIEALSRMRETYRSIEAITAELGPNAEQHVLDAGLLERDRLIGEVVATRKALDSTDSDWLSRVSANGTLSALTREIDLLMQSIFAMDGNLMLSLRRRMQDVKQTIQSLYGASRAACAYASQVSSPRNNLPRT